VSDTPAYRDPKALREAYDDHETVFEAAQDFDASYSAVRRWMIEYGIHKPETRERYGSCSRYGGEEA